MTLGAGPDSCLPGLIHRRRTGVRLDVALVDRGGLEVPLDDLVGVAPTGLLEAAERCTADLGFARRIESQLGLRDSDSPALLAGIKLLDHRPRVYKTIDGGISWGKVFFIGDSTAFNQIHKRICYKR